MDTRFRHESLELLRFTTAGSVDDGKSTLIGRLLYDSKSLFDDQVEALEDNFDLARLTDGLRAEREQGITIDVAYRYFSTPGRRFIIADSPGHVQYTRNMVTAASNAELAVLLVDARKGVLEQTRRHTFLTQLLRIPRVVVAVNKLDLVSFSEDTFRKIEAELQSLAKTLEVPHIDILPISALHGDNVVEKSDRTPWYSGPSMLELLETVPLQQSASFEPARFPVQYVLRDPFRDGPAHRAYAGQVSSGRLTVGDRVVVLPSGQESRIESISTFDGPLPFAEAPQSVSVRLEDDLDVGRGDLIAPADHAPTVTKDLDLTVFWMSEKRLSSGAKLAFQHGTRRGLSRIHSIAHRFDLERLEPVEAEALGPNDVGRIRLQTSVPLAADAFSRCAVGGRLILVDPHTQDTVAAAVVHKAREG